jgi:multiple sugar transport system ATP-binding protein
LGKNRLKLPAALGEHSSSLSRYAGRKLIVGIRPEDLAEASTVTNADPSDCIAAEVDLVEALGSDVIVHVGIDAEPAEVRSSDSLDEIKAKEGKARCVARFTAKSQVRLGDTVTIWFDTARMHFFDGETGLSILN